MRITGGNFRAIRRLLMQLERNLEINQMQSVTKDVIEVAWENLVLGQACTEDRQASQNRWLDETGKKRLKVH